MDLAVVAALPILLFVVAAGLTGFGMWAAGSIFGPQRDTAVKQMPYESGMDPIHDARRRFDIRFHLVAIAFLIFDVEILILYPWAVASQNPLGIAWAVVSDAVSGRPVVFGGVLFFLFLVVLGLIYEWRKGVLQWR